MLPPLALRRLVLAPAVIVATVLAITGLPVLLLIAAAASTVLPGRWRPLRLLWMALLYLVLESVGLVMLFGLWVASGFGWRIRSPRFQLAHYAIVRWYLKVLFRARPPRAGGGRRAATDLVRRPAVAHPVAARGSG
jgi:hypothetical protein